MKKPSFRYVQLLQVLLFQRIKSVRNGSCSGRQHFRVGIVTVLQALIVRTGDCDLTGDTGFADGTTGKELKKGEHVGGSKWTRADHRHP